MQIADEPLKGIYKLIKIYVFLLIILFLYTVFLDRVVKDVLISLTCLMSTYSLLPVHNIIIIRFKKPILLMRIRSPPSTNPIQADFLQADRETMQAG